MLVLSFLTHERHGTEAFNRVGTAGLLLAAKANWFSGLAVVDGCEAGLFFQGVTAADFTRTSESAPNHIGVAHRGYQLGQEQRFM